MGDTGTEAEARPGEEGSPLLAELRRLNDNLERLAADAPSLTSLEREVVALSRRLSSLTENFKAVPELAKEMRMFNKIMLQVRRSAGNVGMIRTLFEGIFEASRSGRRR